ncbi:MAG: hypothetical protein QM640_01250 [Niabella sp.]
MQAVSSLALEDVSMYENSMFCAAIKNAAIVGAVKVSLWKKGVVLPIQKLFDINPSGFENMGAKSIWHVGRFAISKSEKEGAKLLKRLITLAIYPICKTPGSIMLAECDAKFVRGLNLMGIKTETIAPGITYLGSETLPIYSTQSWLSSFLNKSPYYNEAADFYAKHSLKKNMIPTDTRAQHAVTHLHQMLRDIAGAIAAPKVHHI